MQYIRQDCVLTEAAVFFIVNFTKLLRFQVDYDTLYPKQIILRRMVMDTRRNVVLILVDQLRPDFIGPYGADFIRTPNLDKLAAEGVTFDNAIAASTVCAPSRASILTGQFVSGHDGWTNNIPCKDGTEYLPERLNAAGYMTAAVGCYDHAPFGNPIGYRYLKIFEENQPGCKYLEDLRKKYPDARVYAENDGTMHFKYPEEVFYDRWNCDLATEFIASYTQNGVAPDGTKPDEEDAPFFLYCGFLSPHTPLTPPHGLEDMVDEDKIPPVLTTHREDIASVEKYRRAFLNSHEDLVNPEAAVPRRMKERKAYCELIAEVDTLVGRIVQSLKDNGIYENTTIIFSSDHGSVDNDYNVVTKGPWLYRSQLFVPLIVANDPSVCSGSRSDCLCGNIDIGGTVLDIAGDHKAFGVSRSLIGMSDGRVPEREVHMSEFCDACKTLIDKQYTFTYYPFTGETCLYDRKNDPLETVNLGGKPEYADIERKFLMDIIDFMCIAKGVRLEAHDLTPEIRTGIEKKHPKFLDSFDIAYPLSSWREVERIAEAGLDPDYNEFCREREIKAHYGVYFHKEKPKN